MYILNDDDQTKTVYIAGRYSRRQEFVTVAELLKEHGFEIVSQWVFGGEDGKSLEEIARMDYDDCAKAGIVLSYTEDPQVEHRQGARHAEFMQGYILGSACCLIGPREIIFHHLPDVHQYDTLSEFIKDWNPE